MSADSPRHVRSGGPLIVPSQPPTDRSIIDAVSGFINDVTLSSSSTTDQKDVILWARFETADINEPTPEESGDDTSPLLLVLGYGSGVQVWLVPPSGEAQEVLSWRQGTVKALRVLPTPTRGDCFAAKRPLIALCDSVSPGPSFCSLSFISIRGGEQVKSIKFKNQILDVLGNKRSVVVSFSERFAVFDAATLEDRLAVTTCYPCPCPLGGPQPINPLALGDRWLAYADKKLNQSKRSSGGCEGEGASSYTATVLHAAKSLGKGLRGLGESVAHSLAGRAAPTPAPTQDSLHAGVVTVIDIEAKDDDETELDDPPCDPIVAHFIAHSEAIIALQFDASGMLLVTADRRGHDFHVFRINPHPCGPALASVHHLYVLHRGDTTAKVQDIAISSDARWVAVSTLRGTTHVFAASAYGGPAGVRTHTAPRVVNRLSRFHRSAGLPLPAATPAPPSGSPVSDGLGSGGSGAMGAWFPNPRLPPHPPPALHAPLAQLRPTAALPTHTITRTSSGRQRLSSLSEDGNMAPLLARARFAGGPGGAGAGAGAGARVPAASLYLMSHTGCLSHVALHPRAARNVPKEKICDDTPIELDVEPVSQWRLARPPAAADLLAPLPPASPLLQPPPNRRFPDINMSDEERWLSQVEIVTHAGPHRRLWMGPQFVFKTYNNMGSNSSLCEVEAVEVPTGAARSTPVNVPAARPHAPHAPHPSHPAPLMLDDGSNSECSLEHSPSDSFRRKSLLAEGRAASGCDVRLKEDLAEAMKEDHGRRSPGPAPGGPGGDSPLRGVQRRVHPHGWVVGDSAPARAADAADADADAHTTDNADEARFRPVVRCAAPFHAALPVARPLPRTTTIPVQTMQDLPFPIDEDLREELPGSSPITIDVYEFTPPRTEYRVLAGREDRAPGREDRTLKREDRSPRREDRSLEREYRSLKEEDRSLKIEDRTPRREDRSPKREDRSLKREDRSPKREDRSTKREDRSPKREDRSPKREDRSTKREDRSPKREDRSTKREDRSPKREDRSTKREDRSPKREDRSTKREDRSPKREDRLLKREDRSLKREDRSPKREDRSLKREDRSPKREDRSLKREDRSLKWEDRSFKRDDRSLKRDDRSPKREDRAPPKKEDRTPPNVEDRPPKIEDRASAPELPQTAPRLRKSPPKSDETKKDTAARIDDSFKHREGSEAGVSAERNERNKTKTVAKNDAKEQSHEKTAKPSDVSNVDRVIVDVKETDVNKDLKGEESDERKRVSARERGSADRAERKCTDYKSLPKSNQASDDIQPTARARIKNSPTPKSVSDRDSEVSVKDNKTKKVDDPVEVVEPKEVVKIQETKKQKKGKEAKEDKVLKEFDKGDKLGHAQDITVVSKDEQVIIKSVDEPLKANKESKVDAQTVTLKLPKREVQEPQPEKSKEDEIKTEEQAWDLLLNESEKPVVLDISQQSTISDKSVDDKPKTRRNRKSRKSVEESLTKTEEDSFVEIHAIDDRQTFSGDLVSISAPIDAVEPPIYYSSKTKKSRSIKNTDKPEMQASAPEPPLPISEPISYSNKLKGLKKYGTSSGEVIQPSCSTDESIIKVKTHSDGTASEGTSFIRDSTKTFKSKSLSPYPESRKSELIAEKSDEKDVYIINTTTDDFPEIQITRGNRPRKISPQPVDRKIEEKEPVVEPPSFKSWSSIAAAKSSKKVDEIDKKDYVEKKWKVDETDKKDYVEKKWKVDETDKKDYVEKKWKVDETDKKGYVEKKWSRVDKNDEFEDVACALKDNPESSATVSLQDKLFELCKRTDIMVAECDTPTELNFVEEHHAVLQDLPPLEVLDFALDDFKLEVMRDSLLDVNETPSPICKINIDDILSSIKETTSRAIESSAFNLIDLEKVPAKREKGFSVIEGPKIRSSSVSAEDPAAAAGGSRDDAPERSSDEEAAALASTDSDKEDRKPAGASKTTMPSLKQSAKPKKSRRKKK